MSRKIKTEIARHVRGEIVRHSSPFSELTVLKNEKELTSEQIEKYVRPFYMAKKGSPEYLANYKKFQRSEMRSTIRLLLGDLNWRSRSVGAYFAAIEHDVEIEKHICNLLLRSDVCYAGNNYCIYLASCNTDDSLSCITSYLDYYLLKPDLWFDQDCAMGALDYISSLRGASLIESYMDRWERFVENKPNWNLEKSVSGFKEQQLQLIKLQREIGI